MTDVAAAMPASPERMPVIRSVAILGAGTMGAQIAAHFANAGVPVAAARPHGRRRAPGARARAYAQAGSVLHAGPRWHSLRPAASTPTSHAIAEADWVIEAVVERLDVKRDLLARSTAPGGRARLSARTRPGIPIGALAEGRSEDFRRHWLGTHFFNPPRYLRLLEIVPTPDTDPAVRVGCRRALRITGSARARSSRRTRRTSSRTTSRSTASCGRSRRSPAGATRSRRSTRSPGRALGRPKSATFRTADIAGLDILAHVARTLHERLPEGDRDMFRVPRLLDEMLSRGWLGEKAGQGFYRREKNADGESEILTLDPAVDDLSRQAARATGRTRGGQADRGRAGARPHAVCRRGQGRRLPARDAGADARSTPPVSRRRLRTRSTTSIA